VRVGKETSSSPVGRGEGWRRRGGVPFGGKGGKEGGGPLLSSIRKLVHPTKGKEKRALDARPFAGQLAGQ